MSESTGNRDHIIYSTVTVGRLLRRLNANCVDALDRGDGERSTKAAELSRAVEDAMIFARFDEEP